MSEQITSCTTQGCRNMTKIKYPDGLCEDCHTEAILATVPCANVTCTKTGKHQRSNGMFCDEHALINLAKAKVETPMHPLLNPESKHYQMVDGVEAISRMEQMYSIEDRMAWAKINAMKYRLRIGNKDSAEKEVTKILGYEAYYKFLEEQLS